MKNTNCPFIEEYMIENKLFISDGEIKTRRGKKIKKVEVLDDAKFVKVYIQSDEVLAGLKNSTKVIFEYIFRMLQSSDSHNSMEIEFSYKDYVIFNKRRNIQNPVSEKSFYNARSELIDKKVIAHKEGTTYWFNFNYFFNGDRFSVVREYILAEKKVEPETVQPVKAGSTKAQKKTVTNFMDFENLQGLTEQDCQQLPVDSLRIMNKDAFEQHSPIWWAILAAQAKNTRFTHTS